MSQTDEALDFDSIMKICLLYGKILQESNATNEMIENNIQRIARHLGLQEEEISTYNAQTSFILINRHNNTVKMIPTKHVAYNFEKLVRTENLLTEFLTNKISPDTFYEGLQKINQRTYPYPKYIQILSAACVASGMNVLINGLDIGLPITFLLVIIGYSFYLWMQEKFSIKIFSILVFSSLTCFLIIPIDKLHIYPEPYSILFSCIMPLLPGTTFVNSIKATMDGNYISGLIQGMDAINTAIMLGLPAAIIFSALL